VKYVRRQAVDGFQVVAHLDSGGMADVYLATHGPRADLAVLKVLKEQLLERPEFLAMFMDEGRIMASLQHPNVVRVLRSGENMSGQPYIAMEYLSGDHLGVLLRESQRQAVTLSSGLVARIALQVANGLDYVHAACNPKGEPLGLVHRDISPQNIFVTYDGRVKILDFGIALATDRSVATQTGMLKGKLRYMSPEQVQFLDVDSRSDLYSLGAVLWELLVGRRLFDTRGEYATMKEICEGAVPDPRELRPEVPASLAEIALQCLKRFPAARFQKAAEIRAELLEFLTTPAGRSAPDEISRVAAQLLGERQARKQELISSLQDEPKLRDNLFSDLRLPEEDSSPVVDLSGNTAEVFAAPTHRPVSVEPARPAPALAPLPPPSEPPPEVLAPAARRGRGPWFALGAVVLFLVLAGAGLVWLLSGPPARPAVPDAGAAVPGPPGAGPLAAVAALDAGPAASSPDAADAGTPEPTDAQPALATGPEPAPPRPELEEEEEDPEGAEKRGPVGFLRLRTRPEMEAYLEGRFVGRTPVVDMKLAPGVYHIDLVDRGKNLERQVVIHIRDNEVSSYEFVF